MAEENLKNNQEQPDFAGKEGTAHGGQEPEDEKAKAERYLRNWQRAEADLINYRRRCQQEKEEIGVSAREGVLLSVLPALDDMERALAAIPPEYASSAWVNGVKLVERKLRSILETQGMTTIDAVGKEFDPRMHEAVRQAKGKEGTVVGEMEKGYMFRNRVLRPSKVVVGNGET